MIDADLTVSKIVQEAHDVKTFRFSLQELPEDQALAQKPGQFVSVQVQTPEGLQVRSFSISSSPLEQDHLDITVKCYPDSSAAQALHQLKEGDKLHVRGPFGQFVLNDEDHDVVFIAGGNGVTPLMAMMRYIVGKRLPVKPILIYSNRTQADVIFKDELERLGREGRIVADITLTNEPQGSGWAGLTGRIDGAMIEKMAAPVKDKAFFLCGPPEMVRAMHAALLSVGVPEQQIRMEQFIRPAKKTA
ncbi:hypothetical protein HYV43_00065 [Candidatus Micrarchaeota archaeon]|nr:hypothetical protein [Candidatus Micrarchaeota archaeon]